MRYRFTSEKSSKRSKVAAGLPWPLLAMIAGVPAALSLGVIVLTAPQPDAPRVTREAAATAAAPTALPSQPRQAIAVQAPLDAPAPTVEPPPSSYPSCSQRVVPDGVWCVEYYTDRDQADEPVFVEERDPPGDPLMIHWPTTAWPKPGKLPLDNYRIVMTGTFFFPDTRSYLFSLRLQGSARIQVDGQEEVDSYFIGRKQPGDFRLPINRGRHQLRFEFYLDGGPESIRLTWKPDGSRSDFWLGRYYNNTTMTPPVAMIRHDNSLDFMWDGRPDDESVEPDNFSVQWVRVLHVPRTGWTCTMIADDRVRVYVDGQLIPEWSNWENGGLLTGAVTLHGGRRFVEVHFKEQAGLAMIRFACSPVVPREQ